MSNAALGDRLCAVASAGPDKPLTPLRGVADAPVLSLSDAVRNHRDLAALNLDPNVFAAMNFARNIEGNPRALTHDEIASIHLYTQESGCYVAINRLLRTEDRNAIKPLFPLLRIMCSGLVKLPRRAKTVYRGVKRNMIAEYPKGKEFCWWSFTSCTESVSVLQNEEFVGQTGDRTIFAIEAFDLVRIMEYSSIPGEDEWILFPGSYLVVVSVLEAALGLTMIQLKQLVCPPMCDALPLAPRTPSADDSIACSHKETGCTFSTAVEADLQQHQDDCPYRSVYCEHCGTKLQHRHMFDHTKQCVKQAVKCQNADGGCPFVAGGDAIILKHQALCAFRSVQCQHCNQVMQHRDVTQHEVSHCACKPPQRPHTPDPVERTESAECATWREKAKEHFVNGRYRDALSAYNVAFAVVQTRDDKRRERAILKSNMGNCCLRLGEVNHARDHAQKAISDDSSWYKGHYVLGLAAEVLGDDALAASAFEEARKQQPDNANIGAKLSAAMARLSDSGGGSSVATSDNAGPPVRCNGCFADFPQNHLPLHHQSECVPRCPSGHMFFPSGFDNDCKVSCGICRQVCTGAGCRICEVSLCSRCVPSIDRRAGLQDRRNLPKICVAELAARFLYATVVGPHDRIMIGTCQGVGNLQSDNMVSAKCNVRTLLGRVGCGQPANSVAVAGSLKQLVVRSNPNRVKVAFIFTDSGGGALTTEACDELRSWVGHRSFGVAYVVYLSATGVNISCRTTNVFFNGVEGDLDLLGSEKRKSGIPKLQCDYLFFFDTTASMTQPIGSVIDGWQARPEARYQFLGNSL